MQCFCYFQTKSLIRLNDFYSNSLIRLSDFHQKSLIGLNDFTLLIRHVAESINFFSKKNPPHQQIKYLCKKLITGRLL